MRRLRRYQDLYELDLPIILLVGGATGTGKSTVATEVAYRLGITRVTSTDFVRQTMRAFFSREFMPAIHYSSFEAGRASPTTTPTAARPCSPASSSRRATCSSACAPRSSARSQEGWSMVLEGVHLVPGMLPRRSTARSSCQCVLAIEDETAHAQPLLDPRHRLRGRAADEKYLDAFDDIRLLQAYIVGRARKREVPVIENGNIEDAIGDGDGARARAPPSRSRRARDADAARDARRPLGARGALLPLRELRARDRARGAARRRAGSAGPTRRRPRRTPSTAMRLALDQLPIDGQVVIGAGADDGPARRRTRASARAGSRSTSRSTRSRGAASSRAAATARCRWSPSASPARSRRCRTCTCARWPSGRRRAARSTCEAGRREHPRDRRRLRPDGQRHHDDRPRPAAPPRPDRGDPGRRARGSS